MCWESNQLKNNIHEGSPRQNGIKSVRHKVAKTGTMMTRCIDRDLLDEEKNNKKTTKKKNVWKINFPIVHFSSSQIGTKFGRLPGLT